MKNTYIVNVEFDVYDNDGNEVIDSELYSRIEIEASDKDELDDKINRMDFTTPSHPSGKIMNYYQIV